jgi:hypothetical protein
MTLYFNTNDTNTEVNLHFSVLSSFNLNADEPSTEPSHAHAL